MNPLSLFLMLMVPSFAAGVWARPYLETGVKRIIEEGREHMPHHRTRRARFAAFVEQPPSRVLLVIMVVVAVVACGSLVYTVRENAADDARAERDRERAEAKDQYIIECISALLDDSSKVSTANRQATRERDRALKQVVRALVEGTPADEKYDAFDEESDELATLSRERPIPTFTEYCDATVKPRPQRSREPEDPEPTPAQKDADEAAPGPSSNKKAERKGRRSPSGSPPSNGPRPPSPDPSPPANGGLLPPLPDIELPDIELPDIQLPDVSVAT